MRSAFGKGFERLEARDNPSATVSLNCGVLTIRADPGTSDLFANVAYNTEGTKVQVTIDDEVREFAKSAVRGVCFDGTKAGPDSSLFFSEAVRVDVTAKGGKGDNFFEGDGGDAFIANGDQNVFSATGGCNLFDGRKGANNSFSGGSGTDIFVGGAGENSFSGNGGCDEFTTGGGNHFIDFSGKALIIALKGEATVTGTGDALIIVRNPDDVTVAVDGRVCVWDV